MLVVLSSIVFDPLGYIEIDALLKTKQGEIRRRVSRISTLDGGAVVNDGGYTEGDRTIDVAWTPLNEPSELSIERMVRIYPRLVVSVPTGVFLAVPEYYKLEPDESTMRLLVISKLSA